MCIFLLINKTLAGIFSGCQFEFEMFVKSEKLVTVTMYMWSSKALVGYLSEVVVSRTIHSNLIVKYQK